jgi:hypothetical protein
MKCLNFVIDFLRRERFTTFQFLGISLAAVMVLVCMLAFSSCSKDDDPNEDNRKGEPYKFRVELSIVNVDKYHLAFALGSYNYTDESGFPRTEWLTDPDIFDIRAIAVPSPLIGEYDIPRKFNKFFLDGGVFTVEYDPTDGMNEIITGNLFINNKLIASSAFKFDWNVQIIYNSSKKNYSVKCSGIEMFELDKLD